MRFDFMYMDWLDSEKLNHMDSISREIYTFDLEGTNFV